MKSVTFPPEFTAANVDTFQRMFTGCSKWTQINDIANWNPLKVTNFSEMFEFNTSLTTLSLDKWEFTQATDLSYMFWGCSKLVEITKQNILNWDVSKVLKFSLVSFDEKHNLRAYDGMFNGCTKLQKLRLDGWQINPKAIIPMFFQDCSRLSYLVLGAGFRFNVSSGTGWGPANYRRGFPEADSPQISYSKNWRQIKNDSEIEQRSYVGEPFNDSSFTSPLSILGRL
ncbi:BspA family leucine-rich repeat surface protein [Lactobacillus sp. DCY120]|uniref:BspA family leucine-rich repeat surface protein n=2 Tax=Bombilactobacillus apium TaxID=2675299 RepID=A0A850R912_9LACO|nr:BspA family leucine-rich repeat surface protein [Bombilactobacillus apium]